MTKFLEKFAVGEKLEAQLYKPIFTISIIAVVCSIPFILNNFMNNRPGVGISALVILIAYTYASWHASKGRINFQLYAYLLSGALIAFFFVSIYQQGIYGLLWCYPAVTGLYVIFPMRIARICNLGIFAFVVSLTAVIIDVPIAVRVAITLFIVNITCIIFVRRSNQQQQNLSLLAETDALTGVFNRLKMNEKLNSMILEAKTNTIPLTLIALDLDHFKKINDKKGHDVGDQVLSVFGRLLTNCCRESDLIFRTGGEEFIIAMLYANAEVSRKVAIRIQEGLAKIEIIPDLKVTTSIGIATLKPNESLAELLKRCDDYLYQAKAEGRNCIIENIQTIPASNAEKQQ